MAITDTNHKKKVVVAMSGGVDSSVAAAVLVNEGYDVIGMMLRLWQEPGNNSLNRCCTPDAMSQARRVCAKLGIPFYAVDAQKEFYNTVIKYFIDGYENGITPNPCLVCNRNIRWGFLFDRAMALDADFLSTGHYARLQHNGDGKIHLLSGVDRKKDQSYVLHTLKQEQLSKTLLPIGRYEKNEVRRLAEEFGLPVADRKDSQDLCFIGDDYRSFLTRHAPDVIKPGPILDIHGQEIGLHQGLAYYTIGQRKGLGISKSTPLYVIDKDHERNALIVANRVDFGRSELVADQVNWIDGTNPEKPFRAKVKIRYTALPVWATVYPNSNDKVVVKFENPLFDITPGQAAVIYNQEICLGGGIITETVNGFNRKIQYG